MKNLLFTSLTVFMSLLYGISSGAEEVPRGFQAHLVPQAEAVLASQYAGRIIKIPVKNGDSFKKGNILVSFDCRILRSERKKAKAELQISEATFKSNEQLLEYQSISNLEVDIARAEVLKSKAQLGIVEAQIGFCTIKAPYSGRVVKVAVHSHESVKIGDELMEIVDSKAPEIQLFVPSNLITKVQPGTTFQIKVHETGKQYPATLVRIGGKIDPMSQTIDAYGTFQGKAPELIPGMSGTATFSGINQN